MGKQRQTPVHVVWFKRDLRVLDHAPLWWATQMEAPVLPLYIAEPSFLRAHNFDPAHWSFTQACLAELRDQLAGLGQPLVVRVGEAVQTLQSLSRQIPIAKIWAHEETTHLQGYARDRKVAEWAKAQGVELTLLPKNGVVRGLTNRDEWEERREERMRDVQIPVPEGLRPSPIVIGRIPDHTQLRLRRDKRQTQPGGEKEAHRLLQTFLEERGSEYITQMSSPVTGEDACSRLSPHLAYGTISVRTAVQATQKRIRAINKMDSDEREALGGRWTQSLRAFESRLAWRDHFMQKIEMQPDIDTENLVRAFDGLRPDGTQGKAQAWLEAWEQGETGYPMVDACMRYLNKTGWLNFRMRAMLVSFAAHDLWLHWRGFAPHLARAFLDYEPGIHYSQLQMQSGTAGNKTLRIYDPLKQGQEYDHDGAFVRRWVPELAAVPTSFIHAPHLMPDAMQKSLGVIVGSDYPRPLVDHKKAAKLAKERLGAVRHDPIAEEEFEMVRQMHGSRRAAVLARKKKPSHEARESEKDDGQLRLF